MKPLSKEFLLSRGFCCKNGCKNCPYGYNKNINMKELKTVMRQEGKDTQGLIDLCKDIRKELGEKFILVEVGSYMGESSVIFAKEFPEATIYCIDPWIGGYDDMDSASSANYIEVEEQFDLRVKDYPNIYKLKGFSLDFDIKADVLYLDGSHKYEDVLMDLTYWKPKISKILSGHDYYYDEDTLKIHKHIAGVKVAVDKIVGPIDKIYQDSSWLKIIKNE